MVTIVLEALEVHQVARLVDREAPVAGEEGALDAAVVALQDEVARAVDGEVGGVARLRQGALGDDALDLLEPGAHAQLTAALEPDELLQEGVFKGGAALLEADGVGVGDVVADDGEIEGVRLQPRGGGVERGEK